MSVSIGVDLKITSDLEGCQQTEAESGISGQPVPVPPNRHLVVERREPHHSPRLRRSLRHTHGGSIKSFRWSQFGFLWQVILGY